jgi:hypothetical protein
MLSAKHGGDVAIELRESDHRDMDAFLAFVLDSYSTGDVTRNQAVVALAQVFTAAAKDNQGEVNAWLQKKQYTRWLEDARASRS